MTDSDIPVRRILEEVRQRQQGTKKLLITLDGPCATGKTTLAARLADLLCAPVIHTDDFVVPHARKTPERLSIPGGNCDVERLAGEVIAPWKAGKEVHYRRYDFRNDRLRDPEILPETGILILEGSYCSLPELRQFADVPVFVTAPWEIRERRLKEREAPEFLKGFYERWIPLEDAYFQAYGLPTADMIVIQLT